MDIPQLQQEFSEFRSAVTEFQTTYDEKLKLLASKKSVDVLVDEKIERLQGVMDEKGAIVEKAGNDVASALSRLDDLETMMSRSGPGAPDPKVEEKTRSDACNMILADHYSLGRPIDLTPDDVEDVDLKAFKIYDKHFGTYIRRGGNAFFKKLDKDGFETRLLSVDREPGGGYWVRPEVSNRITKIVFETSPIRQFASVEQIGTDSLEILADEGQFGSGWVAEQEARSETTTSDIGKRTIFAHELYAEPRATQKLLDDAGFNVEGWIADKVAEKFGRDEATAFVVGTGVGQPRGFTTYPAGTATGQMQQVNSGHATQVTADGLFDLVYSLKQPYLRRAVFMAARLTIRDIRKLKDGDSRYLWEPNFQVGQPANVIGYNVQQADDMAAVGAGNLAIAFGDFMAGYTIVDRMGIRTLRDPFTAKPNVKFYTTRRVGGDVVNYEAIKLQAISA